MIIKNIDFSNLFSRIESYFLRNLDKNRYGKIKTSFRRNFYTLSNANLKIYQANMEALEFRRCRHTDLSVYSRLEFRARRFVEKRAKTKSAINRLINKIYPSREKKIRKPEKWMSDDIVYSVGEMLDRITIEKIKTTDYSKRIKEDKTIDIKGLKEKIKLSEEWSRAVERFLKLKLQEINRKGYYECVEETRTYNLKGIKKT